MDNKEKTRIILPFIVLAICVPIIVDFFIFGNSFPSNISNESWAGFLGSFLGSIIGGGCTCWAVIRYCMANMPVRNWKWKEPSTSSCVKATYSLFWDNQFINSKPDK